MKKLALGGLLALAGCLGASAQYYQIANQLTDMVTTGLSAGLNYKGFVEAGFLGGVGNQRADVLSFSTTQGVTYSSWFFMGVGLGADVLFAHSDYQFSGRPDYPWDGYDDSRGRTKTGVVIPLFTDFRFNLGNPQSMSCFIDLKVGCSFLVGSNYLQVGDGVLTSSENFYLRPGLGLRFPLSPNGRQALSVAVNYQLMTSNYWSWYGRASNSATLSAVGATLSYEW